MKEAHKKYIKDDMKSIKGKLEEQRPERVKPFIWQKLQNKSSTSLLTSKPVSSWDLPGGPVVKNPPANARVPGRLPTAKTDSGSLYPQHFWKLFLFIITVLSSAVFPSQLIIPFGQKISPIYFFNFLVWHLPQALLCLCPQQ